MTKSEKAALVAEVKFNKRAYDHAYTLHEDCPCAESLEEKKLACARYCSATTIFYILTGKHWSDFVGGDES